MDIKEFEKVMAEQLKKSLEMSNISPQKINEIINQSLPTLKKTWAEAYDSMGKSAKNAAKNAVQSMEMTDKAIEKSKEALTKFQGFIETNESAIKAFGANLAKVGAIYALVNNLPPIKGFEGFKDATSTISGTNESISELRSSLQKVGIDIPFGDQIQKFYEASDAINQMEGSLISAKVATGEYKDMITDLDEPITSFEAELQAIDKNFLNVANASGVTLEAARKFGSVMMQQLPSAIEATNGALMQNTTVMVGAETSMDRLEATMKVAMGTGLEMSQVQKMQNSDFQKFNLTVQQSLENVSKMSAVSQSLRLPFSNISEIVDNTADGFLYFKDNTQSLLDTMSRLGPAFKAAGLSPEAITKLSQDMVRNINSMGLAQRSFLAMQAGASAGLRGGYQVELLKAQGKFDEIQKMTEKALKKQFGGKIVTLEEASKDEGAARQLAKQVQLVTSGPTKVVDTEAQAYKLFEAMRSGAAEKPQITGAEALEKAVNLGDQRAERQTSELVKLNNFAQHTSMSSAITAAAMVKQADLFAKNQLNSGKTRAAFDKMGMASVFDSLFPSNEQASLKAATESAVGTGPAFREGPAKLTPEEEFRERIIKTYALPKSPEEENKKAQEQAKATVAKEGEKAAKSAESAQEKAAPVLPSVPVPVPENPELMNEIRNQVKESDARKAAAAGIPTEQVVKIVLEDASGKKLAEVEAKVKDGMVQVQERESARERRNRAGAGIVA